MTDITAKVHTLREAVAGAVVTVGDSKTIQAIEQNTVPKGNVFEMAKAAALLAVKQTCHLIPDCHPIPIEYAKLDFTVNGLDICITITVKTIYKTGVEVEAMHGASVAALTMYDMLKPIDKNIEIRSIKLQEKSGGKTDFRKDSADGLRVAVVVCSDSIARGDKEDSAGKAIISKLSSLDIAVEEYTIIRDEPDVIRGTVSSLAKTMNMVILTGGTGLSPRDSTPEAIKPLFDTEIPGIMEAARAYGQQRTPFSMLSRGVAGIIGTTLVLALPGSTKGASESVDALFPYILHSFRVMRGRRHD